MDALLARADPVAGPESWEALRGLFHGALRLYLNRYLNVPPARLPGERGDTLDGLPVSDRELRAHLLEAFDRRQQVNQTARLVARYLRLDLPAEALIATLAYALLREDAGFHAYQSLEAGVRQFRAWGKAPEAEVPLIAAVRYLAAHAPTERSSFQTAAIARRLQRGRPPSWRHGGGLSRQRVVKPSQARRRHAQVKEGVDLQPAPDDARRMATLEAAR